MRGAMCTTAFLIAAPALAAQHLGIHPVGALSTLDVPGMPANPRAVKVHDLDGVLAASWESIGW